MMVLSFRAARVALSSHPESLLRRRKFKSPNIVGRKSIRTRVWRGVHSLTKGFGGPASIAKLVGGGIEEEVEKPTHPEENVLEIFSDEEGITQKVVDDSKIKDLQVRRVPSTPSLDLPATGRFEMQKVVVIPLDQIPTETLTGLVISSIPVSIQVRVTDRLRPFKPPKLFQTSDPQLLQTDSLAVEDAETEKSPEVVVPQVEKLIDYKFNKPSVCWEALQAVRSEKFPQANRRLALAGDCLLQWKYIKEWIPTGKGTSYLSLALQQDTTNANLARTGKRLGIHNFMILSPKHPDRIPPSRGSIANTVEAIIGAVYVDGGESSLDRVMQKMDISYKPKRASESFA